MIADVSHSVISIFGVALCVACALGIYAPNKLIKAVMTIWEKAWGIYAAVIVRLVLGIFLIFAAHEARFPVAFRALGALTIVAAIVIPFVGRTRISGLMNWFARRPPSLVRLWLVFGMAFGGFLIYGVS